MEDEQRKRKNTSTPVLKYSNIPVLFSFLRSHFLDVLHYLPVLDAHQIQTESPGVLMG